MKTFRPGEIARAEDVNANFTEIKNVADTATATARAATDTANQASQTAAQTRADLTQQLTTGIQSIPAQVDQAIDQKIRIGYDIVKLSGSQTNKKHVVRFKTPQPNSKYDLIITATGVYSYSGISTKLVEQIEYHHDPADRTADGFTIYLSNKGYNEIPCTITYLLIQETEA